MKTPYILYFGIKIPNHAQIFCFSVTFFSAKIPFLHSSLAAGSFSFFAKSRRMGDALAVRGAFGSAGGAALIASPPCRASSACRQTFPHLLPIQKASRSNATARELLYRGKRIFNDRANTAPDKSRLARFSGAVRTDVPNSTALQISDFSPHGGKSEFAFFKARPLAWRALKRVFSLCRSPDSAFRSSRRGGYLLPLSKIGGARRTFFPQTSKPFGACAYIFQNILFDYIVSIRF